MITVNKKELEQSLKNVIENNTNSHIHYVIHNVFELKSIYNFILQNNEKKEKSLFFLDFNLLTQIGEIQELLTTINTEAIVYIYNYEEKDFSKLDFIYKFFKSKKYTDIKITSVLDITSLGIKEINFSYSNFIEIRYIEKFNSWLNQLFKENIDWRILLFLFNHQEYYSSNRYIEPDWITLSCLMNNNSNDYLTDTNNIIYSLPLFQDTELLQEWKKELEQNVEYDKLIQFVLTDTDSDIDIISKINTDNILIILKYLFYNFNHEVNIPKLTVIFKFIYHSNIEKKEVLFKEVFNLILKFKEDYRDYILFFVESELFLNEDMEQLNLYISHLLDNK